MEYKPVKRQLKEFYAEKKAKKRQVQEDTWGKEEEEPDYGEGDDFSDTITTTRRQQLTKKTEDNKAWEAQKGAQKIFLSCPLFEVLFEGTRGGGKTDSLIADFAQHVGVGWAAEWRGILFRETYPQLDDVKKKCRKMFFSMFPTATFNKNDHTWTFPDGEQLLLRHMKTPEDYQNYHGHEYPWIGWEELTNWATDECYKLMMSCSRSSVDPNRRDKNKQPMPRKYRATTNPYGKGHGWVKRRWQLPAMRGKILSVEEEYEGGKKEIRPRIAIHSAFKENLKLLAAEPDYEMNIRSAARNPAELAAWLYGDWDITSGGMFDDIWDSKCHVLEPFTIPKTWRIDRSFDWGSSAPASVGWWAESDGCDVRLNDGRIMSTVKGDLFRISEWYVAYPGSNKGMKKTPHEIATGIVQAELDMGYRNRKETRVRAGPADSSIWDDSGGPSIATQMLKQVRIDGRPYAGVSWVRADKTAGSRKNGWEEIRQRLKNAKKPDGGVREKPGIFIFNTCVSFIATVPVLPRDAKDPDDVDTDAEDHIADETRYRVKTPKRIVRYGRTRGTH